MTTLLYFYWYICRGDKNIYKIYIYKKNRKLLQQNQQQKPPILYLMCPSTPCRCWRTLLSFPRTQSLRPWGRVPLLLLPALHRPLPQPAQLHLPGRHLLLEARALIRHAPQEPLQLPHPPAPVLRLPLRPPQPRRLLLQAVLQRGVLRL